MSAPLHDSILKLLLSVVVPGCKDGDSIIVLLVGGDKGTQAKDISRAQGFWSDYLEAKRHGKAK